MLNIQRARACAPLLEPPGDAVVLELLDEIERLRGLLERYRDETPLGHQPHMIAHQVDAALGRVPNELSSPAAKQSGGARG